MMDFSRVFDILPYQLEKFPKEDAFATKINGAWIKYSTQDYIEQSDKVSHGLIAMGISKDDKVAIVSPNRPEWNFVEIGVQQIGAISVPIYPTVTVEDFKYIFNDSGAKIVFVANKELYDKVVQASENIPTIQAIFSFDPFEGGRNWKELIDTSRGKDLSVLKKYKSEVSPEDVLTIIYTSGTTGNPKGVMLTHNNLVSQCKSATVLMPVDHTCRAFSFLPLCHVYERMLSYVYQSNGLSIYYAENMDTIADNLKEVHPHMFVTVPRLLEKVYDKIMAKGHDLKGIKKALFFWAVDLGNKYELNKDQGFWYNIQLKVANKLIFSKWREALGGNVRNIVSGGAALQPRLARIFSAAQVVIMEGYGLTETSPVIAVNHFDEANRMIGTVGPIFPGVEVKIAEDGEILTRGPHIMKGYYNRPDLTSQTIDEDNWLHTGDIGEMVDNKFLKITDRKKEIFKTSGGKYIAPGNMENKFKECKFIEQIMVVGESKKFPSALIVPAFSFVKEWCETESIPFTTASEIIKNPKLLTVFQTEIDSLNTHYAQFEKIKRFSLLADEWTVQNGELTPTLKLKRRVIAAKFQPQIEKMYEETGMGT